MRRDSYAGVQACTPSYVHTHTHTHTRGQQCARARAHTRTRARTRTHTFFDEERERVQVRADRCYGLCSCLPFICVVSHDALSDSNCFSRTAQFNAGRNVRNQLKLVVWNCEVAIDVLWQLTRIDACSLRFASLASLCVAALRSLALLVRSLLASHRCARFARSLVRSLASLARFAPSLASLRSLASLHRAHKRLDLG